MLSSGGKLTIFPNALLSVLQMLWGLRAPGKKEEEEEMEEEECYSSCSRSKQNDWSPDLNVMWKADATGWSKRASDIGTKRDGNCRSGGFTGGGGVAERAEVRAHKWTHAHTHMHTQKKHKLLPMLYHKREFFPNPQALYLNQSVHSALLYPHTASWRACIAMPENFPEEEVVICSLEKLKKIAPFTKQIRASQCRCCKDPNYIHGPNPK